MRIGGDDWRARTEEDLHSSGDESRSVSNTNHVRLADILVNSSRPFGESGKMMIVPPVHGIVLHEGKGAAIHRNDPAQNTGIA